MGRLSNNIQAISSGITNADIHIFIDQSGNVTQIEKKTKDRLKYYIDPVATPVYISDCVIGVSDALGADCTYGIGLGIGDNDFARIVYE